MSHFVAGMLTAVAASFVASGAPADKFFVVWVGVALMGTVSQFAWLTAVEC